MNTKNKQNKSETIDIISKKIKYADAIVIGAGAGLSASAGLNYADTKIFAEQYTPFLKKGFKTIGEGISANWHLDKNTALTYWGFWANHINNVYYKPPQLETYKMLYKLIKDKNHFIITTNGDGQFFKGNIDKDKIFAMQGSYSKFQCQYKCTEDLYDNKKMIDKMLEGFDADNLVIKEKDIPICPNCGEFLMPNLRIDRYFVEGPNMNNKDEYIEFINDNINKSIVFLELGVGYNTPTIIRFPFEQMTNAISNGYLIRVNKNYSDLPKELKNKGIGTSIDIHELLENLV